MLVFSLIWTEKFVVNFLIAFIVLGCLRKVELQWQYGESSPILYVGKEVKQVMQIVTERIFQELAEKIIKCRFLEQELGWVGKNINHCVLGV